MNSAIQATNLCRIYKSTVGVFRRQEKKVTAVEDVSDLSFLESVLQQVGRE